jgi:GT2 family glycosyltransferase
VITSAARVDHSCPTYLTDIDLDAPIQDLRLAPHYERARLLVRLHGVPIGEVTLPVTDGVLDASQLAKLLWYAIEADIAAHLEADGIAPVDELPLPGLPVKLNCRPRLATDDQPWITIVVATRDRTQSLLRCLDSLASLRYERYDVVVVDSAPATSATADALAAESASSRWSAPVTYLRSPVPGLGIAHNVGLSAVTGDIVAFTDDDVVVDPRWLPEIATAFTAPEVFCVTGLIVPAELDTQAQCLVEEFSGFGRGCQPHRFDPLDPPDDPLFPFTAGRFGSGANMSYRTAWLRERGGFDPALGAGTVAMGGDDLATFARVLRDGGVLVYQPAAIVRHWHRREYADLRRQAFGYGVGLGAYLMAAMWAEPAAVPYMLRRTIPALRHLLDATSVKNMPRSRTFPRELIWRERLGVILGPFAYLRSRVRVRRQRSASP